MVTAIFASERIHFSEWIFLLYLSGMKNIIEVAKSYIGQEEKIRNSGFKNGWFEKLMRSVGFYTGAPWCAFFVKLVWKESGVDHSLISGSVYDTMMNATKAGNWHVKPVDGALAYGNHMRTHESSCLGVGIRAAGEKGQSAFQLPALVIKPLI